MTTQLVEPGDYLLEVETTRPLSEEMLRKLLNAAGFTRLAGGTPSAVTGAISSARGGGAASMAMGRPGGAPAPAPAPAPGGRMDRRHFQTLQRTLAADTLIRPRAAVQAPRPKGRLGFVAFHPDTAAVQARTAVSPLPAPEDTSAAPPDEGGGAPDGGGGGGGAAPNGGGGGGGGAAPDGGGGGGGGGTTPGGGGGAAAPGGGEGEGGGAAPEGEGGGGGDQEEAAPEGAPAAATTALATTTTAAPATESLWTRIYNWLFGKKSAAATVAGWDNAQGWAIVGTDQVRRYRLVGQTKTRVQLADIAGVSWKVTQLGSRPFAELVTDGVPAKLCPGALDMRFLTNDTKIGTRQETVALLTKLGFTDVRLLCLGKRAVKPVGSPRAVLLTEWLATAVWPHKTTVLASGNTMLVEAVSNKMACAG